MYQSLALLLSGTALTVATSLSVPSTIAAGTSVSVKFTPSSTDFDSYRIYLAMTPPGWYVSTLLPLSPAARESRAPRHDLGANAKLDSSMAGTMLYDYHFTIRLHRYEQGRNANSKTGELDQPATSSTILRSQLSPTPSRFLRLLVPQAMAKITTLSRTCTSTATPTQSNPPLASDTPLLSPSRVVQEHGPNTKPAATPSEMQMICLAQHTTARDNATKQTTLATSMIPRPTSPVSRRHINASQHAQASTSQAGTQSSARKAATLLQRAVTRLLLRVRKSLLVEALCL